MLLSLKFILLIIQFSYSLLSHVNPIPMLILVTQGDIHTFLINSGRTRCISWSTQLIQEVIKTKATLLHVEMNSLMCNSCGHSLHSSLSFMSPSLAFWALFHCRVHHPQVYDAKELIRDYQQLLHRLQLTNPWKEQNCSNAMEPIPKKKKGVRLHLKIILYVILGHGEQRDRNVKSKHPSPLSREYIFFLK